MGATMVKNKYIYSVKIINTIYFFLISIVILNIHQQITSKNLVVALERFDEVPLLFSIEIFMFAAILGLIKMQLVMIKVDVT